MFDLLLTDAEKAIRDDVRVFVPDAADPQAGEERVHE